MPLNPYPCPMCVDGRVYDSTLNRTLLCPTCEGAEFVTPGQICNCGRPCRAEDGSIVFCGREECLKALKEAEKRIPAREYNYNWRTNEDMDDWTEGDTDFPPLGTPGHRIRAGFGGMPIIHPHLNPARMH